MSEKTLKIELFDDSEDGSTEHDLPAKNVVCVRCRGDGTHLNPSIGSHAYTPEEFEESFSEPEQREAYFQRGGMYDVPCEVCAGARVVLEIDAKACKQRGLTAVLQAWRKQERERMQGEADDRRTMARESGCWE